MKKSIVILRNWLLFYYYSFRAYFNGRKLKTNSDNDFVVSIASYPQRDHLVPAVFEKLNRSSELPKKWILVLSVEEYDQNNLPKHIEKLNKRGVEIVWSVNNPFAVKTLVPVLKKYKDENLVALDDDFLYYKNNLKKLLEASKKYPNAIVGLVGKELYRVGTEINMYFRTKNLASEKSPRNSIYFLKGSGTLYPRNSINEKALDVDAIHKIVPGRGADMWFWAAAHANRTDQVCIGNPEDYDIGVGIPEYGKTVTRENPTHEAMNERFQKVIDYFGIRERLLEILPEKES